MKNGRERRSRLLKRASLVLAAALLLAGCNVWSMYGQTATHSSDDSSNVITTSNASTLEEAGTTKAVSGTDALVTSSPTIASNDMLYVTGDYTDPQNSKDTTGELYAYSASGGTTNCPTPTQGDPTLNCQPVWTAVPIETNALTTAPAVDLSLSTPIVYVGSHNGDVYAYNASNGKLVWHSETLGGSIDGSITIANGYLYVPEDYGWVYVFPSTTGTNGNDQNCFTVSKQLECDPDWGYWTAGNNFSTPAVANGMMYQAAGDHVTGKNNPDQYAVYGFNASYQASECPGTYAPHESGQPLTAIATCAPAWSAPWQQGGQWDGGGTSPSSSSSDVYIESATNGLLAFSAAGSSKCSGTKFVGQWGEICTPLWIGTTGDDYVNDSGDAGPTPAIANGDVYIGDRTGKVYAFNETSGALTWSYATGGAIDSSVAVAGDSASDAVAFVGCSTRVTGQTCSHSFFAFKAASGGTPLWTANTGGSIDDPTIVGDAGSGSGTGAVYVPSGTQVVVYALPTSS